MKLFSVLIALTAFVAAHEGEHDAQGNHLDDQGNIIAFKDGTKPSYPIPPSQQTNSNGSQNQNKEYPLPPSQGGDSQPTMEEFQKFMQSPLMLKFMEYVKLRQPKQ
jgi:hypothetical protein